MSYDFSTLITALDTKAQALAADSATTAKDLIYLGKAIEAINDVAGTPLRAAENLSDLGDVDVARSNLLLPKIDISGISDGQTLVWNQVLSTFQAGIGNYIVSSTNPTGNETGIAPGMIFINSSSAEIFIAQTSAPNIIWIGSLGNSVNVPQGQAIFYQTRTSSSGSDYYTQSWTVPNGVHYIGAVMVGGGGGGEPNWSSHAGSGGGLAWANNIAVTPGETLSIEVGRGGWDSGDGFNTNLKRGSTLIMAAGGGKYYGYTESNTYSNGFSCPIAGTTTPGNMSAGRGGLAYNSNAGGGGGAGGYTGDGGNGGYGPSINSARGGNKDGTGGGAGGGNGYGSSTYGHGGGGGTGLYGEGTSGAGGNSSNNGNSFYSDFRYAGEGGSGGEQAAYTNNSSHTHNQCFGSTANSEAGMQTQTGSGTPSGNRTCYHGSGGMFGGGGGGSGTSVTNHAYFCAGGNGGLRIIYGHGRSFPKVRTGNV